MLFYDINIPSNLGYTCQKRFFPESSSFPVHWHSFIEIELFIEGTGVHEWRDTKFPINSGELWILSNCDSHRLTLEAGTKSVNIALSPDILHKELLTTLNHTHPLHCSLNQSELANFLKNVDTLDDIQNHPHAMAPIKAVSIINELLVDAIRKTDLRTPGANAQIVNQIIDYINDNYQSKLSIVELADRFSLTPNYFGFLFKKTTGIPFNDYLNSIRLKHACNFILNTNLTLQEISVLTGFNSLPYFNSTFKKFYGITPAKYRSLTPRQLSDAWRTKITPQPGEF